MGSRFDRSPPPFTDKHARFIWFNKTYQYNQIVNAESDGIRHQKKYEFTDEVHPTYKNLKRIRALKPIMTTTAQVFPGDLGGWIERENNLDQYGNCWVFDEACVFESACVSGDACICDTAHVFGAANIYGSALVLGDAKVGGFAHIFLTMSICFDTNETPPSVNTIDGYTMTLDKANGKISAGCRYFTFEEAIEHWKNTRSGTRVGENRLKCVEALKCFM